VTSHPPALVRGIELLRLLESPDERGAGGVAEALSVEEIFERTGFPRSSLRRLLDGLEFLGCVERDAGSRKYAARVRLLPIERGRADLGRRIAAALAALVERTGLTAEWYVPTERGMVLADRRAPESGELRVQARLGFMRAWGGGEDGGEIEAVCVVGRAFFARPTPADGMWQYDERGGRKIVSARSVSRRVAEARSTGVSADARFNGNGVRRCAAVVLDGRPPRPPRPQLGRALRAVGILALAEPLRPGADGEEGERIQKEHLAALSAAAKHIGGPVV